MAITLSSTNGLFTRLGKYGGWINSILNGQGAASLTAPTKSAQTAYTDLLAQFVSGSAQSDLFDGFVANRLNTFRNKSDILAGLKADCQALLIRQVNDDVPLKAYTLDYAMRELIRQMAVTGSGTYVSPCTVAATTPTAGTGNTCDYKCTSSKTGPLLPGGVVGVQGTNAMDLQYILPESVTIRATDDSKTGSATAYQEPFSVLGQTALYTDPMLWNYTNMFGATATNGSGANTSLNACDAAVYAGAGSGGNLLYNGDFATFVTVAHQPDHWVAVAGTPNTDFTDSAGTGIRGGKSLKLIAGGATVTLTQQFGDSTGGTSSTLEPNTVYAWNVFGYKGASATGTVTVDLIDGSATVIADNNAVNNTLAWTGANMGTAYTTGTAVKYGYFRTPNVLPSVCKIRISTSAANVATEAIYLSNLALRKVTPIYTGGGYAAVFSGGTAAVAQDYFLAPFTNNYGGGTNKYGFVWMFQLLFDMVSLGLSLPVVGSTNLADSLVS